MTAPRRRAGVECRGLRLGYGASDVLAGVDLHVAPGEFFALLGPSGSGKSTLLRAIAGFAAPREGRLLIDGRDVAALPPWRREVGMVFQSYALWPHLSVRDNVAFGLVERRVGAAQIEARVAAALDLVGLGGYGQRRPGQLSGGQQQRVALARTLVVEPLVLLLDEPLSNLDRALRVQMREELLALQRRLGITTIFVTHDQEEAMATADRMAVLDRGVVQQVGTPRALYDQPANAFVAAFVGTTTLLPARRLDASRVEIDGVGVLALPPGGAAPPDARCAVSLRPHGLRLALPGEPRDERLAWWDGEVAGSEFLGAATRVRVRVGARVLAVDHPHAGGAAAPPAPGTRVAVGVDAAQARVVDAAP